ncbi:hypothetical protein FB451DRAFT_1239105 [Mycena latifolia]|nr:hypothetical protein FB451DRAFT_1239105 [Mycena latifolia]
MEKTQFKRCKNCKSYYCSEECQYSDWKNGGHREVCTDRRLLDLSGYPNPRERSFLRVLMHHDYESARVSTIYPAQVLCMHKHPNETFLTIFDYSQGPLKILVESIHSHGGIEITAPFAGRAWTEVLSRAARSHGKMEIHLLFVSSGGMARFFLVPLRTNSSAMHEALKKLAKDIPAGANTSRILPELTRKIQALVDDEGEDVVRIHS